MPTLKEPDLAPPVTNVPPEFIRTPASMRRMGSRWSNYLKALFGLPSQRRMAYAALQVNKVRFWEDEFDRLSDAEVKLRGQQLRGRARGGDSLTKLLPEVFGLACVACKRQVGLRPFDVQIAAGVVMHHCASPSWPPVKAKRLPPFFL